MIAHYHSNKFVMSTMVFCGVTNRNVSRQSVRWWLLEFFSRLLKKNDNGELIHKKLGEKKLQKTTLNFLKY